MSFRLCNVSRYFLIFNLILGMGHVCSGQADFIDENNVISELPQFVFEANLIGLLPKGDVAPFIPKFAWGGDFSAFYRIEKNGPFLIGLNAHLNTFEKSSVTYDAQYDDGTFFRQRETAGTHLWHAGAAFRFQPEWNFILQPYAQGQFGINHYFANSKFRDLDAQEDIETINEQHSTVFAYGLKAGVLVIPNIWYIRGNLGIGYLSNISGELLSFDENGQDPIPINNFAPIQTAANFLTLHAGVTFLF